MIGHTIAVHDGGRTSRSTSPRTWSATTWASSPDPHLPRARQATERTVVAEVGASRPCVFPLPPSTSGARPARRRLVTAAIKGKPVEEALRCCAFMPQYAARDVAARPARARRPTPRTTTTSQPTTCACRWRTPTRARRLKRFRPAGAGSERVHPSTATDPHHHRRRGQEASYGTQSPPHRLPPGDHHAPGRASGTPTRTYTELLQEDSANPPADRPPPVRRQRQPGVEIERSVNQVTVTIHTAKPGIVIGKQGREGRGAAPASWRPSPASKARVNIKEIRQPELDAYLVARSVAEQLERRVAFRRAMKQAVQRTMRMAAPRASRSTSPAASAAPRCPARRRTRKAACPLHTLRADVDFGQVHAATTYGRIGVKVWIYRGDIAPERAAGARDRRPARQP